MTKIQSIIKSGILNIDVMFGFLDLRMLVVVGRK